jgi:hypothetical protein
MFMDSILEHDVPGIAEWIEAQEEAVGALHEYGLDIEAMEDDALINNLQECNPNPFGDHIPENFSEVTCEPPNCPLAPTLVSELDVTLSCKFNLNTSNMEIKKFVWDRALDVCRQYF